MAKKKKDEVKPLRYYDYSLVFLVIFLLCFGLVMLYSISSYYAFVHNDGNTAYYVIRQGGFALGGLVVMFIVSFIPYDKWLKLTTLAYWVALGLCIVVNFVGKKVNGQRRWIELGPISFQPSELGKVAIILIIAKIIYQSPKCLDKIRNILKMTFFYAGPIIAAVVINNLSTAIILAGITFCMMFVASSRKEVFGAAIVVVLMIATCFVIYALNVEEPSHYWITRIQIWRNVETHEKGYQTLQGLYAIGSGGLFGKGLGESMQKLGFIPEPQNDMIFTVICEELGLFGAMCVILLFVLVLWRMMIIANNAADIYGSMIVVGVMSHIAIQVILNIAVVTNVFPNTGISLPFISYGGTALVCLLGEIGMVLGVARGIKLEG